MKMKRVIRWTVINSIFALLMWSGFEQGIDGARRVASFWLWLTVILSLCVLSEEVRQKMANEGPSVPQWIDGLFDMVVIAYLVWHGHEVMATGYTLHAVLIHSAYRSKPKTEQAA